MRILHLVHQYVPEHVGGTELYTQWLAQEQSRRGHEVTVFYRRSAEGAGKKVVTQDGVRAWAEWAGIQSPTRRFLATLGDPAMDRAFERALQETRPELIHVQHLMGLPVSLFYSVKRHAIPFVITFHDFWWVCANAQLLTNYSQRLCDGPRAYLNCAHCALARAGHPQLAPALPGLAGWLAWRNHGLRQVVKAARRLIAPTEFVRAWYAAHGAPTQNLIVVLLGMGAAPVFRQIPKPGGIVRFAYIGGLSWQKGVHVLVEAFRQVKGTAELWIAGDESFDPSYVARLRALALPNVRFLGKLAREQVWETLAQVDAVVVPAIWYETFSFIVSEAFFAGVPVVASRLGPLADRVRDGTDGLLVSPGDTVAWRTALQRLVDEPGLLAHLRAGVHPPVMIAEHAVQTESLYAQVIDECHQAKSARPRR